MQFDPARRLQAAPRDAADPADAVRRPDLLRPAPAAQRRLDADRRHVREHVHHDLPVRQGDERGLRGRGVHLAVGRARPGVQVVLRQLRVADDREHGGRGPVRPHGRGHAARRRCGVLLRAPVLDGVHAGGPAVPHLLRQHQPVHVRDARAGDLRQHALPVHLLGDHGLDELPAHRALQPRPDLPAHPLRHGGVQEGLPDHARRRRVPPDRDDHVLLPLPDVPVHRAVAPGSGRGRAQRRRVPRPG